MLSLVKSSGYLCKVGNGTWQLQFDRWPGREERSRLVARYHAISECYKPQSFIARQGLSSQLSRCDAQQLRGTDHVNSGRRSLTVRLQRDDEPEVC